MRLGVGTLEVVQTLLRWNVRLVRAEAVSVDIREKLDGGEVKMSLSRIAPYPYLYRIIKMEDEVMEHLSLPRLLATVKRRGRGGARTARTTSGVRTT